MKKVLKYGTGQEVPKDAVYLCSLKNGIMARMTVDDSDSELPNEYERYYVWHYFLVEDKE